MEMNIKTYLERFGNGDFDKNDVTVQCAAGWYDWFCRDSALMNKTIKLTKKLKQIVDSPKINTETMYVFFKNNCPMVGPLRDDFRICDIKTGKVLYTITPEEKTETCQINYGGRRRKKVYTTSSSVWGRENEFEIPLVSGCWQDVKDFFLK